jgi:putative transposase
MIAKSMAFMLADLGITKTHSRPHVSNDNPFSESQFKTLKYRPEFPDRFGSPEHARSCCGDLLHWYNTEHHHVGLGLFTPHHVHHGLAAAKREQRARVLADAFTKHPERLPNGLPSPTFGSLRLHAANHLPACHALEWAQTSIPARSCFALM